MHVIVYDFESGEHQFEVGRHQGAVHAIGFSLDESKLLSFGQDCAVKLWDVMRRKELSSFGPIQTGRMCDSVVKFTAGPEYHVATHDYTCTQIFTRMNTQSRIYYHGDASFVLSADGSVMTVRGTQGIPIITTPSMTVVRIVPWEGRPAKIVLSANGQYLCVRQNFNGEAASFRLDDGSTLPTMPFDGSETDEQFYTDSRNQKVYLIAVTKGGSIKVWDTSNGSLCKELSDPSNLTLSPVYSVSVAENFACGILVASLNASGLVWLWDVDTGTCLLKLGVGMDRILSTSSRGTYYFVMISSDGSILLVRRQELTAVCMLHGSAIAVTKAKEALES